MMKRLLNKLMNKPASPEHGPDWHACQYSFHCKKCGGVRCRNNVFHHEDDEHPRRPAA